MTVTADLSALSFVLRVLAAAPKLRDMVLTASGSPSSHDAQLLVQYTRRLDERRVFREHFDFEVTHACVRSIEEVKDFTDITLAQLKHPAACAFLGAILDELRTFLDKWAGHQRQHRYGDNADFFADLGALREKLYIFVAAIGEIETSATALRLGSKDDPNAP